MNIEVKYGLPFIEVTICYRGEVLHLKHVLLDTGSAGTIFSADVVEAIGVKVEPGDVLNKIRGVGGVEVVYSKFFDFVRTGGTSLEGFEVEIGEMNYGMEIDGIIGFDYIQLAGLIINSKELTVSARE
ncbi:retropepsin-like aspartic protease [Paenibacillus hexagrammi]|uniref:Retropepsin-like domain-containing protein n=1 Tax=Paenibacillus hexagrammi TaxID=2908839 RepID=A0ABY3SGS0_9BACL|nr:retropepsin-like aspartic protease [Paenibacillus sp. YPD9-1]UJF33047.1 retropepsin-like domain-containing protein [Paenibacillus sp. YPD9-1]